MSEKPKHPYESSGTSTSQGYFIEVRTIANVPPRTLGKQIVTREWTRLHYDIVEGGGCGVPVDRWDRKAAELGVLTYVAAQSLMAWVDATAGFVSCLEYRLVRVTVETTHKISVTATGAARSFFKDEREAKYEPVSAALHGGQE